MKARRLLFQGVLIFFHCYLLSCFFPLAAQETVRDTDGNPYATTCIGKQTWFTTNLRVTSAPDGSPIQSFCFNHDTANARLYGRLYAWTVAMDGEELEGSQGLCPGGWHIPSDSDWMELANYLGGQEQAGKRLRQRGQGDFCLQYAGNYFPKHDIFSYLDQQAYYWTSSKYTRQAIWIWNMGWRNQNVNRSTVAPDYCFSIRCIKD